jgi:hypothetical protein
MNFFIFFLILRLIVLSPVKDVSYKFIISACSFVRTAQFIISLKKYSSKNSYVFVECIFIVHETLNMKV